jgi:hypothetical protein
MRTSDINQAKLRSLEEGQRVGADVPSPHRAHSAQTDPESLARLYSSRAEAEDAAWRAKRKVDDDEQLDVELDALTSAVEDHTDALKLRDVDLVSKLLDEVLFENGLTISAHRRREFALALRSPSDTRSRCEADQG